MSAPEYIDLTQVADEPALGVIVCNSSGFPPTHVSWERGNSLIPANEGSNSYEQIQRVVSRTSSLYSNILVVKDIHGVMGDHVYRCLVRNRAGSVSRSIEVSTTGKNWFFN